MPSETIVAVFETSAQAERAAQALVDAGVPEDAIERHSKQSGSAEQSRRESGPQGGTGFFFWDMMFGMPSGHQDRSEYERSIERGETVLAVTVAEPDADAVMSILERESPLDVDERGKQAPVRAEASQRQRTAEHEQREEEREKAPAKRAPESRRESEQAVEGEEEVIPLAEERLEVGKRTVNRGTTRIRRYVVESPVEKTVPLRDERVTLERRQPTTDKVTGDALTEKTVEVTETSEVPETEKVARLKEEVVVRREAVDREEQVRDTVRRDEIAVEEASEAQRESPRRKKAG